MPPSAGHRLTDDLIGDVVPDDQEQAGVGSLLQPDGDAGRALSCLMALTGGRDDGSDGGPRRSTGTGRHHHGQELPQTEERPDSVAVNGEGRLGHICIYIDHSLF